jgi:hypothetical protein
MHRFLFLTLTVCSTMYAEPPEATPIKQYGQAGPILLLPKDQISKEKVFTSSELQQISRDFSKTSRAKEILNSANAGQLKLVADGFLIGDVANTAQDKKEAFCYRCALGQLIGQTTKDWCARHDFKWDVDRTTAKESCR